MYRHCDWLRLYYINTVGWRWGQFNLAIKSWSVHIILYQGYKGDNSVTVIMHPTEIKCHSIIYMYTVKFTANSYGESWDSSRAKSWIQVQYQWVPVQKTISSTCKLKMLGPLCIQTVKLKTDSKPLFYSILKLI